MKPPVSPELSHRRPPIQDHRTTHDPPVDLHIQVTSGNVNVLLVVTGNRGIRVTFKNGDKFTTPVKYPEKAMVDLFAEGLLSRKW